MNTDGFPPIQRVKTVSGWINSSNDIPNWVFNEYMVLFMEGFEEERARGAFYCWHYTGMKLLERNHVILKTGEIMSVNQFEKRYGFSLVHRVFPETNYEFTLYLPYNHKPNETI